MTEDASTENTSDDEELVFGVDFSKINVSAVDFLDDNGIDTTGLSRSPFDAKDRHLLDLLSKPLGDIAPDGNDSCNENGISELFQWATGLGANLDQIECRNDKFGGRGLYVKSECIFAGDFVATLPRSLRIGQKFACQKLGLPKGTADLSALSLMIVDASDRNEIFARCLPRHCCNAVFMTEKEHVYWARCGDEYTKAIVKIKEQAKSCVQYIQDCILGADPSSSTISEDSAIWWAIAMAQSRTHGFGSNKSRWMTPIFDFCNHSTNPSCRLEGDAEGNLTLKANRTVQKGEEVTIDYQVPDDAKLVATYGFSLKYPGLNDSDV
jgi:hypothetical protein